MDEKEIYEICMSVDSIIAAELTESIVRGTSYDMLEAHHGVIPISRRHFYQEKGNCTGNYRKKDGETGRGEERTVYDCMGKDIK